MSQTDELLSNIHEYCELLRFLDDKYREVLNEWRSKNAGFTRASSTGPIPEQATPKVIGNQEVIERTTK